MRRAFKLLTLLSLTVTAISGFSQSVPGLPLISNFQKIAVSQQSLFQGRVIFDQGLDIQGDGRFLNNVYALNNFSVAKDVTFSGLRLADQLTYLLINDESGQVTRVPFARVAEELSKNGIGPLENLSVTKALSLDGNIDLNQGAQFSGLAVFNNNLTALSDMFVAGNLSLNGLQTTEADVAYSVLGIQNGIVVRVPFPKLGESLADEPVCLTGPDGKPVKPAKASWQYSQDLISTNKCNPDIKVGIGQNSATERLEVNGNIKANQGIFAGRKTGIVGANSEFLGKILIGGNENGNLDRYLQLGYDGARPYIDANFPNGDKLSINGYSNLPVHIGNSGSNLTVNGDLIVRGNGSKSRVFSVNDNGVDRFIVTKDGKTFTNEVNVQLGAFPDYVFESNYQLMPLSELEAFIKANKHLPNMPSASEVAKEGADLGEMVRLLVEKNEELTLHIIDLQKRIKELESAK